MPFLGFQFVKETVNSGTALDMFSCKECICNVGEVNKEKVARGTSKARLEFIKLISAVWVPAQHEKLIKAKVCNMSLDMKVAVFEMDSNFAQG